MRTLWRTFRSRLPSLLGPALLPQNLQGQLPCKNSQGPRAHKKVALLAVLGRHPVGDSPWPRGKFSPLAEAVEERRSEPRD